MKNQSLLFFVICLLFALAAKGSQDTTFDIQDSLAFEGKSYHNLDKICVPSELAM